MASIITGANNNGLGSDSGDTTDNNIPKDDDILKQDGYLNHKPAIVTKRPPNPARKEITKPIVVPEDYQSPLVDTRYIPIQNLLTSIDGASWKGDFYQQILGKDNAPLGESPSRDAIYQQYRLIKNMVLKVTDPLSWEQDETTKLGTSTGGAYMYPPFIPNQGDMFVADVGDGNKGIFNITSTTKLSMFKQSVYQIRYTMIAYANEDRMLDLNDKVVDTKYFDLNFLVNGQNPYLDSEGYRNVETIRHYKKILTENYFTRYYSDRFKAMVLPDDGSITYEPYMTKMISSWFSMEDYYKLQGLMVRSVTELPAFESPTIFDVLEEQDKYLLSECVNQVGVIRSHAKYIDRKLPGARLVGFDKILYPVNGAYTIDAGEIDNTGSATQLFTTPLGDNTTKEYKGIKLINDIDLNQSYIFSQAFYHNEVEGLSHIEILLNEYLEGQYVDKKILIELIKDWKHWGKYEQFYYTPIMLMLMHSVLRE